MTKYKQVKGEKTVYSLDELEIIDQRTVNLAAHYGMTTLDNIKAAA